ncbi:diguanylate cyclase [Luteimonas sp. MC1782]|uniref:sensor domain-containing diguanylate cyclase n=1 Tax=Luteimonas sp. MC1782 TaxID=2760305 RepID=UPI001600DEE3|nr:sensor domain-containing diguanylate cyclase [Luteimonas sp. MC1782]MBB1472304.1 diguanylate cyclase [Luteimonas sp. MC1782]
MRTLAVPLAGLAVGIVLQGLGAPAWAWAVLLFNMFAWPHVAWWRARRSDTPQRAEFHNLMVDAFSAGAWIATMQFNLVPSAVFFTLIAVANIAVGGWRFAARTTLVLVLACLAVSALQGFPVQVDGSLTDSLGALPFLVLFACTLALLTHALGRRVARQNRLLERLNRMDVLTGLPNRRHWNQALTTELTRHMRTRRPAVLLLIDVDNFKEVNDEHGHAAGDEVLRCIADVLRACVRDIDTAARHGGDEFGVLLAETDLRGGAVVAERIRTGFLAARSVAASRQDCTLSIGMAEADWLVLTADEWMHRADAAMYRAKDAGRNRVEVHAPELARTD